VPQEGQKQDRLDIGDLQRLYDTFREETDRGAAIVGAAYLDESLKQLISGFMVDKADEVETLLDRPLSSFWSRILAAYCMGLISGDEYADLDTIRDVRNLFAHEGRQIAFEDPAIHHRCDELVLWRPLAKLFDLASPRSRFLYATTTLLWQLSMRALRARVDRRKVPSEFELMDIVT
jgi:DNA-binding MltR family transcriptional regulator